MSDLADKMFGPLPKDYCVLFYYLSILGFVWFVIALTLFVSMAVSKCRGYFLLKEIAKYEKALVNYKRGIETQERRLAELRAQLETNDDR